MELGLELGLTRPRKVRTGMLKIDVAMETRMMVKRSSDGWLKEQDCAVVSQLHICWGVGVRAWEIRLGFE